MKNATLVVSEISHRALSNDLAKNTSLNIVKCESRRRTCLRSILATSPDLIILDQLLENPLLVFFVDVFKCCHIPLIIGVAETSKSTRNSIGYKTPAYKLQEILNNSHLLFNPAYRIKMKLKNGPGICSDDEKIADIHQRAKRFDWHNTTSGLDV